MNKVILVGRLTADPELRYTPEGTAVANFTLAVNRPFTNSQGNREADFIRCQIWRKPAENAANYLKKGSRAAAEGRWQTRSYEQDGKNVYVSELVVNELEYLETASSGNGGNQREDNPYNHMGNNNQGSSQNRAQQPNNNQPQADPFRNNGDPIDISDDDLPF